MADVKITLYKTLLDFEKASALELMRANDALLEYPGYEISELLCEGVREGNVQQFDDKHKIYYSPTEQCGAFVIEREKEQKELDKERAKHLKCQKRKKILTITAIISTVSAVIAGLILLTTIVIPNHTYDEAVQLMAAGKYEQAIKLFSQIGDHKGAKKRIEECNNSILENKYQHALSLMKNAEYEQAGEAFEKLEYKDSADKSAECLYLKQLSKMQEVNVGDVFSFGMYEQDSKPSNGAEELEWIVLERDGDKLFVVSRYLLEDRQYDEDDRGVWETCSLRQWLNGEFYETAFNTYHRERILLSTVEAHPNTQMSSDSIFGEISSGNDTEDYVFLLSEKEVREYQTLVEGAQSAWYVYRGIYEQFSASWCLRTPGYTGYDTVTIARDGGKYFELAADGILFSADGKYHVRPAMWIDLSEMRGAV